MPVPAVKKARRLIISLVRHHHVRYESLREKNKRFVVKSAILQMGTRVGKVGENTASMIQFETSLCRERISAIFTRYKT